jgi:hypothetical protein
MATTDADTTINWLNSLAIPRPLIWQSYVSRRRIWYGFLCLLLLVCAVLAPLIFFVKHMQEETNPEGFRPAQIALALGAGIVVSYVIFILSIFKQYDDIKWLGQRGLIAEANIFAVYRSNRKLMVGYRFWDEQGQEREREAIIDVDESRPILDLAPGMVVPLLYDQRKPEQRNYLWAEASNFLTER